MRRLLILLPTLLTFLQPKEIKVASYNLENLFDLVYNGTEYKEYVPKYHNWNIRTFQKKIKNISRVICELNADVIGLQEVENENALNELLKYLEKVGCKYEYSAITHKKGSAIQVALISKIPIDRVKEIVVSPHFSDRNILEVTLDTSSPLTIFVNHWRSKRAKERERIKYAKALMRRLKRLPEDREYIILGDFNSEYNECSRKGDNSICGIDTLLKTTYKNRLIKLDQKPPLNRYHYNLWSDIVGYKRWSYSFYGKKGAIDSIIISSNLNDNVEWFYKRGSFGVFKKRYLFKDKGMLNKWVYRGSMHKGEGYSDHLPIYAIFRNGDNHKKYESILDIFWSFFVPSVKEKRENNSTTKKAKLITFDELLKKEYIKSPVILKNVCVIYKRGDFGAIKASQDSKTITLYRTASGLEEGRCYDFKVLKKVRFYGLEEITSLDIIKERGSIDINKFIKEFRLSMIKPEIDNIGEIVKEIKGVYKSGNIIIDGEKIKLYVKSKKRGLLLKGNSLYIKRAQIGLYKGKKELIVHSLEDIKKEN